MSPSERNTKSANLEQNLALYRQRQLESLCFFFQCNLDVCHAVDISKPNINLYIFIFELNTGVNGSRASLFYSVGENERKKILVYTTLYS